MQTMSEIELMMECGICLEILDDTNKMLPCQHTFHRGCLENLLRNEGSIHCPICRANVAEPIDSLQRHFVLSIMVDEYWRKLTSAPSTEDEDLAQATKISREEFRNGSYADLLKQIEELQMQLATENSKQEAYIHWIFRENPVKITDEYQELIQYHMAIDKSEENESIGERQTMISNKKKLECQLACLKSILDNNLTLSSGITSGINQLLAGVACHIGDLNDEQRTEVEMALRCLRGALMTFQNNESIQIQAVTDKMVAINNNQKSSNQDPTKNGSESTDAAINDLMKNLEVIKTIISEEGQTIQIAEHQNQNYLNQYLPNFIPTSMSGISNPQSYASMPPFHVLYPLHDPPLSAYDWPPSATPAKLPHFSENADQLNFPPGGKNPTHDPRGRDKSPGFNKLPNTGSQTNDIREERTTQIAEHQNQNYLNQYPPKRGGRDKSPGFNNLPNTGSQRIKDRPRGPPPPPPPPRRN